MTVISSVVKAKPSAAKASTSRCDAQLDDGAGIQLDYAAAELAGKG